MSDVAQELNESIRQALAQIDWQVRHREIGTVVNVGDGVAYVSGLPAVGYGELLERRDGLTGLAFDLQERQAGILFLDPSEHVSA